MMQKNIVLVLIDESENLAARLLSVKDWDIRNQMYAMTQELVSTGKLSAHELNSINFQLILFAPLYSILKKDIRIRHAPLVSRIVVWFIALPISAIGPARVESLYQKIKYFIKSLAPVLKVISALVFTYSVFMFIFFGLLVLLNS